MKKLLTSARFQVGFTLIELLIVIVIIVIVVAVGAVSYTTVNRNARDSQRKADLAKISQALEMSYSDFGYYPVANDSLISNTKANTSLLCYNTGYPPHTSSFGTYPNSKVALASGGVMLLNFSCQDFITNQVNIYIDKVQYDPLNTKIMNITSADKYYYNYYSYYKDGRPCWEIGNSIVVQLGGTRCQYLEDGPVPTTYKPIAYKYKLVAIMENSSNATNGSGDQDPAICRYPGYCYVVPSPNF